MAPPTKPTLFISHKHGDAKIALCLAKFIESRTQGRVTVYLSSSAEFEGPRYGPNLNDQLRRALWYTDVLLLVYTSADLDWSYCMWECGVATDSQSPETNIIVFQCGRNVPPPFQDVLRVNPRVMDDMKRFANQFLRDPSFFPTLGTALIPMFKDEYVQDAAEELHSKLQEVVPVLPDLTDEWPTWPFMCVELPRSQAGRLQNAKEGERAALAREIVTNFAEVVESDSRAAQLFGLSGLPQRLKLSSLLAAWKAKYPNIEAAWFDSCCEQVMMGAGRGFPIIRWSPVRQVDGDAELTPVVSRVRELPFAGAIQFDLYFYNLSDPRAVPVTSKMIPMGDFFSKDLDKSKPEAVLLKDLIQELESRKLNRIPMFSGDGKILYIAHRSMFDKFIAQQVFSNAVKSPAELTLADLLEMDDMRHLFESTFAVVSRQATLAEARSAMLARQGCSDVFVTAQGSPAEPVQGWLTNVDIVRSS